MSYPLAYDASWTIHSGAEYRDAGASVVAFYVGNALPNQGVIDDWLANGLGLLPIQESDPLRSLGGYAAGVVDAQWVDMRLDSRGAPDCAVVLVVSDNSSSYPNEAWQALAIQAYARGFGDALRRPCFVNYGNTFAVDAATSGHAKSVGGWVPVTWNARDTDLMWQMANTPSPLDGTDLNWIINPIPNVWNLGTVGQTGPQLPVVESGDRPTLSVGSSGPWVANLQNVLNEFGYDLVADGDFGGATNAAVIEYQRSRGLEADGVVGPMTWGQIDADYAALHAPPAPEPVPAPPAPEPGPAPAPEPVPPVVIPPAPVPPVVIPTPVPPAPVPPVTDFEALAAVLVSAAGRRRWSQARAEILRKLRTRTAA